MHPDSPQTLPTRKLQQRLLLPDVLAIGLGLLVILSARSSLADHYVVPTGSMEPTVQPGDRIAVSKLAYGLSLPFTELELLEGDEPAPGDVVVLRSPIDHQILLKRVVAVGGDEVEVRRGRIVRNGVRAAVTAEGPLLLEFLGGEAHPIELSAGGGPGYAPTVIPPGKVLVMGDNRGNSFDGRSFGLVDEAAIRGRAVAVYRRNGRFVWRAL